MTGDEWTSSPVVHSVSVRCSRCRVRALLDVEGDDGDVETAVERWYEDHARAWHTWPGGRPT